MGRPAKEPFLKIRRGDVELVLQVVGRTKAEAVSRRPPADTWAASDVNVELVADSTATWMLPLAALVRKGSNITARQQALPFPE